MTKNIKINNSKLIDKLIVSQIKQVMKNKNYKEYENGISSIIKEINLNIRNKKIYLDSKLINLIIALSQLSRQVEQRDDKKPQLSDLRESGSIEQDSDVVMFIYREEYYLEKNAPSPGTAEFIEWQQKMDEIHGQADLLISKQRHGPTGNIKLSFDAKYTRFGNFISKDRTDNYE